MNHAYIVAKTLKDITTHSLNLAKGVFTRAYSFKASASHYCSTRY